MPHVALPRLGHRVVVDINNLVEVPGDDLGNLVQLLEIKATRARVHEFGQCDRGQITYSDFVGGCVFNDF